MCRSAAQLPLRVVTEPLAIPAATVALINKHLVLCYSGQARLARNLLQGVLRRWFGRLPEVCLLTSAPPPRRVGRGVFWQNMPPPPPPPPRRVG
jgi:hypothetical protein